MAVPVDNLTKDFLDSSSDDPSQARAEIEALLDKTKEILAFLPFRGALVYNSANQAIGGPLSFDTEVYDTDNIHDIVTNSSRLTVPPDTSKVELYANMECTASASTWLFSRILKNGAIVIGLPGIKTTPLGAVSNAHNLCSAVLDVVPGDSFELAIYSSNSTETIFGGTSKNTFFGLRIIE